MRNNANLQTIQYKTLHRTHYTRETMFKMGFTSETCSYCTQNTTDTYNHVTWNCTPIKLFWKEVTETLSCFLGCLIPLSPKLCLLGDLSELSLDGTKNKFLLIALTIAKKTHLHELEIKKQYTFISLEKLAIRSHFLS